MADYVALARCSNPSELAQLIGWAPSTYLDEFGYRFGGDNLIRMGIDYLLPFEPIYPLRSVFGVVSSSNLQRYSRLHLGQYLFYQIALLKPVERDKNRMLNTEVDPPKESYRYLSGIMNGFVQIAFTITEINNMKTNMGQ
jgi:hypothetical protein